MKAKVELSNEKEKEMNTELERLTNRYELQRAKDQAVCQPHIHTFTYTYIHTYIQTDIHTIHLRRHSLNLPEVI